MKKKKEQKNDFLDDYTQIHLMLLEQSMKLPPSKNVHTNWLNSHSPKLEEFKSDDKKGKWCIQVPVEEIDSAWEKIKNACKNDDLMLAKCSTALQSNTPEYPLFLICVYTKDWDNKEDVQKVRQFLKDIGFTQPLKYKRDIETINGVYNSEDEFYIVE